MALFNAGSARYFQVTSSVTSPNVCIPPDEFAPLEQQRQLARGEPQLAAVTALPRRHEAALLHLFANTHMPATCIACAHDRNQRSIAIAFVQQVLRE